MKIIVFVAIALPVLVSRALLASSMREHSGSSRSNLVASLTMLSASPGRR